MRELANADIRKAAKEAGVSLWELADYMNISEPTLTRKLRRELSEDEKCDLIIDIGEIVEEHRAKGCSPI